MEKLNQKRRGSHSLAILFILSGSLFDISDLYFNTTLNNWTTIHCALKDLQVLGFALLCFNLCEYSKLKTKAFIFMLVLWRILILFSNILIDEPSAYSIIPLYVIYVIFLYRIVTINEWPPVFLNKHNFEYIQKTSKSFNVLIPVNTFRGLLQILFTRSSPKYETRLLVSNDFIYSVQHNKFVKQPYEEKIVKDLMEKAGAKVKLLGFFTDDDRLKYENLLGKRTFTGIRDCRRLEI